MTAMAGAPEGHTRWGMLAIISLGVIALTLNWFDVATAFPLIGAAVQGRARIAELPDLVVHRRVRAAHIPGGMLATAIGMKKTLVLGLVVQGLAGIMSGLSQLHELELFRVVSGIGGSVFIAVGFAAVVVWFRARTSRWRWASSAGPRSAPGAAFALYIWVYVQRATSWHTSLVLAGVFELLVAVVTRRLPGSTRRRGRAAGRGSTAPLSAPAWPAETCGSTASRCSAVTAPTSPHRSCSPSTPPRTGTSTRP